MIRFMVIAIASGVDSEVYRLRAFTCMVLGMNDEIGCVLWLVQRYDEDIGSCLRTDCASWVLHVS